MAKKETQKEAAAPTVQRKMPPLELRRLEDQVALVTGGNRGIGFATARALAREGASVLITGRDERTLHHAADQIKRDGGTVVSHTCDVRDEDSVDDLFAAIRKHFAHIDILFNNAGLAQSNAHVDHLSLDAWRSCIETNLTGAFLCTRAALPMLSRGGTVVNNVSVAANTTFPGMAAYSASKAGLMAFTNTLREELRPRGIRVISLVPGATDTEIWQQFWKDAPREKMMSVESVAEAVVAALCLPENTTIEELLIRPTAGTL